jgi:spermidine synthase
MSKKRLSSTSSGSYFLEPIVNVHRPLGYVGFYAGISKALKEDGIFVAQTDNPWFTPELITNVQRDVKELQADRTF